MEGPSCINSMLLKAAVLLLLCMNEMSCFLDEIIAFMDEIITSTGENVF